MKRIEFFICLLAGLLTASGVFAKAEDFAKPGYDFTQPKKIVVLYHYLPAENDEHPTYALEAESISQQRTDAFIQNTKVQLAQRKASLHSEAMAVDNMHRKMPNSQAAAGKEEELLQDFVKSNYDLVINVDIMDYDIRQKYVEGHYENVPVNTTTTVRSKQGGKEVVNSNSSVPVYVPPGYYPAVYCTVRCTAYAMPQNEVVWTYIDERDRVNMGNMDTTKPKDVYGRIINAFFKNLGKKLKVEGK